MLRRFLLAVTLFVFPSTFAAAQQFEASIVESSIDVLDDLTNTPDAGIPRRLLQEAKAVAVFPHVIKAGFIVGGRHGRGIISIRNPDGTWSAPVFLSITGGSIGFQAGAESTDLVLVFRTRGGLDRILEGKDKLKLGADVSIAAGPVGRAAGVGTDGQLRAEIFSYSRNRGLFAGASIGGSSIKIDYTSNDHFYAGQLIMPMDIVRNREIPIPEVALRLEQTLTAVSAPVESSSRPRSDRN